MTKLWRLQDKRVENWLLMSSPLPTLMWDVVYIAVVLMGFQGWLSFPRYRFRPIIILYNIFLILLNAYICISLYATAIKANYSFICQPVDYSDDPLEVHMAWILWLFYFSKLIEFGDTLLFILRGNLRQVTYLHVYHHISMFTLWWIGVKWVAGGSVFIGAATNSGMHVLMYGYYLVSTLRPGRRFWWKRIITGLQLVQFFAAIIHGAYGLYIDCPFPKWMGYALIGYAISLVILFSNFWIQNYGRAAFKKARSKKTT